MRNLVLCYVMGFALASGAVLGLSSQIVSADDKKPLPPDVTTLPNPAQPAPVPMPYPTGPGGGTVELPVPIPNPKTPETVQPELRQNLTPYIGETEKNLK